MQMGSIISQAITTTDIKAVGTQIFAWVSDNGGTWTPLRYATDSTYTGVIGPSIHGNKTFGGMDDFEGGDMWRLSLASAGQFYRKDMAQIISKVNLSWRSFPRGFAYC